MKKTFLCGALLGAAALLSPEAKAQNTLDYNAWVSGSNRGAPYNDFSVNTQDRAAVSNLWTQVYRPMTGMPTGWHPLASNIYIPETWPLSTIITSGSLTDTFKWATLSRLNYFRAMAGVETRIALDSIWTQNNQVASFCMFTAGQVSNTLNPSWPYYTPDAATASAAGLVFSGLVEDPSIIDDWMVESGGSATNAPVSTGNNWSVGHRRSLLSNGAATFGIGMTGTPGAIHTAVGGCNTGVRYSNAPAPRDELIAWPAPGYAPYKVVYPRWHAEWPSEIVAAKYGGNLHMDADTTVTVTRNGQSVPVYSESLAYGEYSRPLITFTLLGCATGADYDNVTLPQLLLGGPNIATAQAGNPTLDAPGAKAQVLSLFDTLAIPRFDSYPAAGTSGTLNELGFSPARTLPDAPYHVKIDNIHIKGVAATGSDAAGSYTYYTNEELMSVEYDVTVFDPEAPAATAPAIAQQVVTKTGTSTMLAVGVSGGSIIAGNAPKYQWYKCSSPNAGNAGPGSSVANYIYNTYGSYGCGGVTISGVHDTALTGQNTANLIIIGRQVYKIYGNSRVSVTDNFQASGGSLFFRCATVSRSGTTVSFTGATLVLGGSNIAISGSSIISGCTLSIDGTPGFLQGSLYLSGSNVASGTLTLSGSNANGTVSVNGGSATLSGSTVSLNGCNLSLGNCSLSFTGSNATLIPYTSPAAPSIPDAPSTSTSNAGNSGTLVSGATQSYLNIIPSSAENYWVRVTNSLGSVSSDETTVSIYDPVVLTSQPTGGRFSPLNPQPLTVSARGGGNLTYQWYMNGRPVAGATGASYTPQANVDAI